MSKQVGLAVIFILLGFGLTQLDEGANSFYIGAGLGTVIMASLWLVILIIKDLKKKK